MSAIEHTCELGPVHPILASNRGTCDACAEKMYVACRQCGEVFDDLTIAFSHTGRGPECGSYQGWDIVTESEAF